MFPDAFVLPEYRGRVIWVHVEGKAPFNDESLEVIADLKRVYGLELDARASHRLSEAPECPGKQCQ